MKLVAMETGGTRLHSAFGEKKKKTKKKKTKKNKKKKTKKNKRNTSVNFVKTFATVFIPHSFNTLRSLVHVVSSGWDPFTHYGTIRGR
jgi:hypothetical protein